MTAEITGLKWDDRPIAVWFNSEDRPWTPGERVRPAAGSLLCPFFRELIPPPADHGTVLVPWPAVEDLSKVERPTVRLWGHSGQEWAIDDDAPGSWQVIQGRPDGPLTLTYHFRAP